MNVVILASIVIRIVGVGYSLVLLSRSNDRRFGFLTIMLSLMATRQILTAQRSASALEEFPGLIVSVLAFLTVYYLSSYVVEEQRITERLEGFRKAIEHAGHAIFLTDTDGMIEYANPAVENVTGNDPEAVIGENPRIWKSGEHDEKFYEDMWNQISSGEIWEGEIINRRASGELCWVDTTIAPITDEDGTVERYVAVERDVTERKERQIRIEEQNDRLERLNNTNEVLRDVNQELVAATSRRDIERSICDRFAQSCLFEAAWIGEPRLVDEQVRIRARAGIEMGRLKGRLDEIDYRTIIEDVLASDAPLFVDGAGTTMEKSSANADVAVPLSYHDANYGVLIVEAATDSAFEAIDQALFAELGSTVGDAINAAETRQTLASDDVTELEFLVDGAADPLVRLSDTLDCTVELEHVVIGDAESATYISVVDADPTAIAEYVDDAQDLQSAQSLCTYDERCIVRVVLDEASIVTAFAQYGATVTAFSVTGGYGRLHAEVSRSNDIRSVVEAIQTSHPQLELYAQREHEREAESETEFRSSLEDALTDRQLEAARTAYFAGFFEWPRETSGEEVATIMDISQSTFTQHLRAAEQKLFRALFEDQGKTTVPADPP